MLETPSLLVRIGIGLAALGATAFAQGVDRPSVRPASFELLEAAGLATGTVQDLDLPARAGEAFTFPLDLDGVPRTIEVAPYSLRSPSYRLMVRDEEGERPYGPTADTSYRGIVVGAPESVVALNLFEGRVQGVLQLAPGEPFRGIQPADELVPGLDRRAHVVYSESDVLPLDVSCGGAIDVLRGDQGDVPFSGGAEGAADGGSTKVCEIAIDSDVEFFQKSASSVTAAENDITSIMNSVEAIYQTAADVLYEITVIYVETAEPDPYSTSSASGLLNQFQNHWNSQHQGDPRDVAHFFTGRNLSGSTIGIAYLNVICNKSSAYGLSESKFTGTFSFRVGLTAHELGHNWSANHCDGQPDCKIMCSGLGGCSGSVASFGSGSINKISAKKGSSVCLSSPPPPAAPILTGINPGSAAAFQGGEVTLTGSFLDQADAIHVGGVTLAAPFGFTVQSGQELTFHVPKGTALGPVQVTASNEAGTSNPVNLTYVATSPPKLAATAVGLTGLAFHWDFGAQPSDLWFLLVGLNDPSTVSLLGHTVLAGGLVVGSGTLNPAGIGTAAKLVPPGGAGASVYSQVLLIDSGGGGLVGSTNITTSTILL